MPVASSLEVIQKAKTSVNATKMAKEAKFQLQLAASESLRRKLLLYLCSSRAGGSHLFQNCSLLRQSNRVAKLRDMRLR